MGSRNRIHTGWYLDDLLSALKGDSTREERDMRKKGGTGLEFLRKIWEESTLVSIELYKIIIPVTIIVKVLQEIGAIRYIAAALAPVMHLVGLPGSMGFVWATTMFTNLYAGMVAFTILAPGLNLTAAQVTVLTSMMLIAHSLPVEVGIAKKSGVRIRVIGTLRLMCAFLYGWLLNAVYLYFHWNHVPNKLAWVPKVRSPSLIEWSVGEIKKLVIIFFIIVALHLVLEIFDRTGITGLITKVLKPVLRFLRISESAMTMVLVGMVMGLAYGGGLIIKEAKVGTIDRRDIFSALVLLSLCHSLIEDTLLMVVLGGKLSGLLWGRMIFAFTLVFVTVRVVEHVPGAFFDRFLFKPVEQAVQASTSE